MQRKTSNDFNIIQHQSTTKQDENLQKVITIGVMSRVEKWLSQNQKTMAKVKHGDVNPSYKSKNMILHIDRVQGKVMQYSVNHLSPTETKGSIYDTDEEDKIQFLESSMTIDIPK